MTYTIYGYPFDYILWWLVFASLVIHTACFFRFFPRRRARLRLVLGNVLMFATLGDGAALAGETYYRFIHVGLDPFGMTYGARRWLLLYGQVNTLGCRDVEWEREPPEGVRRIAFVGDSFTYGWGIRDRGDRFPDLVGAALNRRAPHSVEVMNVAKPGWDTGEETRFLSRFLDEYAVDEVVLCYVPNDIEKILPTLEDFDPTRPPEGGTFFNLHGSALIEYLYYRVYVPRAATVARYHDWLAAGYAEPRLWRRQRDRLDAMIDVCREHGVTFRAVLFPFLAYRPGHYDPDAIHRTLRAFFEQRGVPCVDLLPVFADRDPAGLVLDRQDAHPNAEANRLAADAIVQAFYGPTQPPPGGADQVSPRAPSP